MQRDVGLLSCGGKKARHVRDRLPIGHKEKRRIGLTSGCRRRRWRLSQQRRARNTRESRHPQDIEAPLHALLPDRQYDLERLAFADCHRLGKLDERIKQVAIFNHGRIQVIQG